MKIELSEEQVQHVVEALLFCSTTNMCADWGSNHLEEMMNTAFQISDEHGISPRVERINYYDCPPEYGEEFGEKVKEKFPYLVK